MASLLSMDSQVIEASALPRDLVKGMKDVCQASRPGCQLNVFKVHKCTELSGSVKNFGGPGITLP